MTRRSSSLALLALLSSLLPSPAAAQEQLPPAPAPVTSATPAPAEVGAAEEGVEPPLNFKMWPFFERVLGPERQETTVLYVYHSLRERDHEELHLHPFFDYVRDGEANAAVDVLWPLFSHSREGEVTRTAVRPFYWSKDDPQLQAGYRFVLPLWLDWWAGDERTIVALPGAVYARRGDRQYLHLWPFFGRHDLEGGGSRWFSLAHGLWLDTGRAPGSGGFAAPFPLVYADWSPDEATTVALPLLFARRRQGPDSWWLAFPFALGTNGEDSERLWTIPYAYTRGREGTRHDVLFPLFSYASSFDGQRAELSARPLFWWDTSPERTWSLALPLYYRYESASERRLWTLPYAYTSDAERTRHDVLFPLFTYQEANDGSRTELSARPLFWYDSTPERTWSLGLPLYYSYASEDTTRFWTIPYWYNRTPQGTRHDALFSLLSASWSADDSERAAHVFPLFWYGEDAEQAWSLTLPLLYTLDSERETRVWSLPYAYTRDEERTRHDVLFPLFSYSQRHDDTRTELSARPLFWYDSSPERTWSLGVPLYYSYASEDTTRLWTIPYWYNRTPAGTRHDALFSLFSASWSADDSEQAAHFFPLFWYGEDAERAWSLTLPLLYTLDSERETRVWSLPYAYTRDEERTRHDVLFPLFSYQERHDGSRTEMSARPLFWYDSTPERTWSLGVPLYYSYASEDTTRFWTIPYWYNRTPEGTRHDALFSLLSASWSADDSERAAHLFPLFWYGEDAERAWSLTLPLLYTLDSERETRVWSLPYAYTRDEERTRHDVLFPLFSYQERNDGSRTELSARPLFWYDSTPERTWSLGLPLYYSYASEDTTRFWTIPYWYNRTPERTRHDALFSLLSASWSADDTERAAHLFPLFWYGEDAERAWSLTLPLLYTLDSERETRVWSLPYAYTRDEERTRHDVLFPLFSYQERHDGSRTEMSARPLFWYDSTPERTWSLGLPLYYSYASEDTTRFWTIPYWYNRTPEGKRHDALFSLLSASWSADDTERAAHLFPLFWYGEDAERAWSLTLPLLYTLDSERETRVWSLPYAYTRDEERTRHDVLFPLFTYSQRHDDTRTELSARPLFWYDSTPERTWSLAFPLYYRYSSEDESKLWTLPYAYTRDRERTRHDVLFPLFTHAAAHDDSSREISLRPLFFYDRTPERTWSLAVPFYFGRWSEQGSLLITPLFVHSSDGAETEAEDELVGVPPLYWQHRSGKRSFRTLFPLYFDHEDEDGRTLITPVLSYFREGDYCQVSPLWPLGAFGGGGGRSHARFLPLFLYDEDHAGWRLDLLYPLLHTAGSEGRSEASLLAWLATWEREGEDHDLRVLGWWYRDQRQADRERNHLLPLWWRYHDAQEDYLWVLYPLFEYERAGAEGEVDVLGKLYTHSWGPDRSEWRLLYKLLHYRQDGGAGELEVQPFFSWEWTPEQETFQLLGGLYYRRKLDGRWKNGFLWGLL